MKKSRKVLLLFVLAAILTGIFSASNVCAAQNGGAMRINDPLKYQQKLESGISAALVGIKPTMSSLEKVKEVNEYLAKNVKYAYGCPKDYRVGSYGALVNKKAICAGYACAFDILMKRLGIPDTLVDSGEMDHCWNMVRIGENWYHVDTTWDRKNLYGCFMKSDAAIAKAGHGEGMKRSGHFGWKSKQRATSTKYDHFDWVHASPETVNRGIKVVLASVWIDTSKYRGRTGKSYMFLAKSNIGEFISADSSDEKVAKVASVPDQKDFLFKITFLKEGSAVIRVRSACNAVAFLPVSVI